MSLAIFLSNDITASKKSYTPNRYDEDDEFLFRISLIACVCDTPQDVQRTASCEILNRSLALKIFCSSGYSFSPCSEFSFSMRLMTKSVFGTGAPRTPPLRFAAEFLWWLRWRGRRRQGARC